MAVFKELGPEACSREAQLLMALIVKGLAAGLDVDVARELARQLDPLRPNPELAVAMDRFDFAVRRMARDGRQP